VQPPQFWRSNTWKNTSLALGAALVTLFFFAPRFAYWRLSRTSITSSEVVRVHASLAQLAAPFVAIDDHTNRVLHWRLFFPLVGHVLRFPGWLYLSMPFVGCWAVLIFVVWLARKHGMDSWGALAAAILTATGSWFFVSSGWLGYFDSWLVLGLLAVVFASPWGWGLLAIVVTPWIDERFVIALPLLVLLRLTYQATFGAAFDHTKTVREIIWMMSALLPWLGVRAGAIWLGSDAVTDSYLRDYPVYQSAIPWGHYFSGLWYGIRWAWLFVLAVPVLLWRRSAQRTWLLAAVALLAIGVSLAIAEDLSRSAALLVPMFLLGLLQVMRARPKIGANAVFLASGLNLVSPAMHVSGAETWPVRYLYVELDRLNDPACIAHPGYHNERAAHQISLGDFAGAKEQVAIALQLDPDFPEAYANRATIEFHVRDYEAALADLNRAVALQLHNPALLRNRSAVRAQLGDVQAALSDLKQALREAGPEWPLRQQMITKYRLLQRQTSSP